MKDQVREHNETDLMRYFAAKKVGGNWGFIWDR